MEKAAKPQYLPNDPPGEDQYDGKPQERIAHPLAEILRKGKFKLIGLDGAWGSGKSNVIGILKEMLKGSHHFFVYDAWSHQEDLQRRAFLEEFTADLVDNKVVVSSNWAEDLKDLLAKKRDTITKTVPKVNPAYYALAGTVLSFYVTGPLSEMICDTHPWWRLFVHLSPAILLLLIWSIAALRHEKYRNLPEMLAIYKEKELEKTTAETISEKEPSVKQFRDWMTKVSDDLKDKKVVVVFDNMDRLPAEKVKALWSGVQTFFSETKGQSHPISFIVPFDRSHISKAFGDGDAENEQVASQFINKTFPVIFNVALPSLTSWKGLFKIKFKEAFGEIPVIEYEQIEHIFDLYQDSITPRSIIAFINDMVTLTLIWQTQIAMRYMALFVGARKDILKSPLDQILKRDFAAKADLYFNGDDELPKNIAALVYNVPLDTASQVTLYREIQIAFRARDNDRVKELYLHPDFVAVLKAMIPGSDVTVEDCVLALSSLEDSANNEAVSAAISPIWPALVGKQTAQPISVLGFAEYYRILIEKVVDAGKLWSLVAHLIDGFYNINATDGAEYFNTFSALEAVLKERNLDVKLHNSLRNKDVTPEYFLAYVATAKEKFKKYKVSTNSFALDSWLVGKINTEFQNYESIEDFALDYPLPNFKTKLREDLSQNLIQPQFLYPAIFAFRQLEMQRPANILINDEKISALLKEASTVGGLLFELLAMKIARGKTYILAIGHMGYTFSLDDEQILTGISSRVEYYKNLDDLIKEELTLNENLAKAAIRQLIIKPSSNSRVDVVRLLTDFVAIQKHFGLTDDEIFNAFNVWYNPANGVMAVKDLKTYLPDLKPLQLAAQQRNNRFAIDLLNATKEYLATAEVSDWHGAFSHEGDYLFDLTSLTLKERVSDQLPPKAYNPFKDALKRIARRDQDIYYDEDWNIMYDKSDASQLGPVILNIRDEFINDHSVTPKLFAFFERMLREHGALSQRTDDVIRTIIHPLVDKAGAVESIQAHKPFYLDLLKSGSVAVTSDVVRVIRDAQEAGTANEAVVQFALYLDQHLYSPIDIIHASYLSIENPEKFIDVTNLVRHKANDEWMLHLKITNDAMGMDPDPGHLKKLTIEYKYNSKNEAREWNEGEFWRLPNG